MSTSPQVADSTTPYDRADDRPTQRCDAALRGTGLSRLTHVRVHFEDDQVILDGEVPTFYLKQLAQEAIRPHSSGKQICNRLKVGQ